MRRREFIAWVSGGALAWPLVARAQQQTMRVIGVMSARSPVEAASDLVAFRHGLEQSGYFEGKNLAIGWAEGRCDQLPALAAELVARQVVGGEPSGLAAKAATATIPIVCTLGGNAVAAGLVAHLNRPGGNVTGGTTMGSSPMASSRLPSP